MAVLSYTQKDGLGIEKGPSTFTSIVMANIMVQISTALAIERLIM